MFDIIKFKCSMCDHIETISIPDSYKPIHICPLCHSRMFKDLNQNIDPNLNSFKHYIITKEN